MIEGLASLKQSAANRLRAVILGLHRNAPWLRPWTTTVLHRTGEYARVCNICNWHGSAFEGGAHSESAVCPSCNSIARDRFLYHCLLQRTRYRTGMRVLETSPRLGEPYRNLMRSRFDYQCSDFDDRSHRGDLHIDLQSIELPAASLEVVLTPHVLEHVPDTGRALAELWRVLRPGGKVFVQVPLLQGTTSVPAAPEYHGDHTLVYWRFGWDLTDQIRSLGFVSTVLVPEDFRRRCLERRADWETRSPEFAIDSIVSDARAEDLTSVADDLTAHRLGFEPSYMFATWECAKPAGPGQ